MSKKRKGRRAGASENEGPDLDVGESRKRIKDFEDVADSDDEFHINRDEILLGERTDVKRRRKLQEQEAFLEDSDEEVLGYSDGEDGDGNLGQASERMDVDEEVESDVSGDNEDEDEEIGWGMSKSDMYGADDIETEEQALEEEAEARRLQAKQLHSMSAADYGFDEANWIDDGEEIPGKNTGESVVTEVLPQLEISDDMGSATRLKLLKSRCPEFEPLTKELLDTREIHEALVSELAPVDDGSKPNARTKLRAIAAYLGSLAMYFALMSSPASDAGHGVTALSAAKLRSHPVMDSLVQCRQLWVEAEKLPSDLATPTTPGQRDEEKDAVGEESQPTVFTVPRERKANKSRVERHAEAVEAAAQSRRAARMEQVEADLADLDDLIAPSDHRSKTKSTRLVANGSADSDVGEDAALTASELAEKARRKKSLRFYTSQIAQKANKRDAAGRNVGADDDIPYRERLRDRQARLNVEAEKRGRRDTNARADLGGESDEDDERQAQQIRAEGSDDEYYDLVAARTAKKKADKAALAEAQKQAALQGGRVVEDESVGADGKRKITYAIEKNKGLTPHRKKDVRNPRVKKRKKFDEKKKKLASIKPVYKGGEGRGGYGGELTGIKKGVVKSVKL